MSCESREASSVKVSDHEGAIQPNFAVTLPRFHVSYRGTLKQRAVRLGQRKVGLRFSGSRVNENELRRRVHPFERRVIRHQLAASEHAEGRRLRVALRASVVPDCRFILFEKLEIHCT